MNREQALEAVPADPDMKIVGTYETRQSWIVVREAREPGLDMDKPVYLVDKTTGKLTTVLPHIDNMAALDVVDVSTFEPVG